MGREWQAGLRPLQKTLRLQWRAHSWNWGFLGWLQTRLWIEKYMENGKKLILKSKGLLAGIQNEGLCLQCGRPKFNPWVGKISWRRKWQPTPVFLLGKFRGQRSRVGYSPWGRKESDTTEQLHFHFHTKIASGSLWWWKSSLSWLWYGYTKIYSGWNCREIHTILMKSG